MSSKDCARPPDSEELLDLEIVFDPGTGDDDDLPTLKFSAPPVPAITRKVLRKIRPLPKVSPPPLPRAR